VPSDRCSCGGPLLALMLSGRDRDRFMGTVCAHCRKENWVNDPRDANVPCCCGGRMDVLFVRWYGRLYGVGEGCVACRIASWGMDEPGAELHPITHGISSVVKT